MTFKWKGIGEIDRGRKIAIDTLTTIHATRDRREEKNRPREKKNEL